MFDEPIGDRNSVGLTTSARIWEQSLLVNAVVVPTLCLLAVILPRIIVF
jgi:hypothetical protein